MLQVVRHNAICSTSQCCSSYVTLLQVVRHNVAGGTKELRASKGFHVGLLRIPKYCSCGI